MTHQELQDILDQARGAHIRAEFESCRKLCIQILVALGFDENTSVYPQTEPSSTNAPDELRHKEIIVDALRLLGANFRISGDVGQSLEYFSRALSIAESLEDKIIYARTAAELALAYNSISETGRALDLLQQAVAIAESLGNQEVVATFCSNIGIVYRELSEYAIAIDYYHRALRYYEQSNDKRRLTSAYGNIAVVHSSLGEYEKALEYNTKALALAEKTQNTVLRMNILGNIGLVHHYQLDYPRALEAIGTSLALAEEIGDAVNAARQMTNLSSVYFQAKEYELALNMSLDALSRAEKLSNKVLKAINYTNLGGLYVAEEFTGCDYTLAEEYLLKSIAVCEEIGERHKLFESCLALAELYEQQRRWEEFAIYFRRYHNVEREVRSEDVRRSIQRVEVSIKEREYEATRNLLYNVLPSHIAKRLMNSEHIADAHDNVSVLFADIVNFTELTQNITPAELVEGLDAIYTEFDLLAEQLGLEKIKTIGDAYMIVAGAPVAREDHASVITQMAFGMMNIIKESRAFISQDTLQLRIGIHSGEVVAGVIGKKKFTYDLWGDTVNIAARMESYSEPGKIHVTADFIQELSSDNGQLTREDVEQEQSLTIDNSPLIVIPRGEIEIKGKGVMRTFFLELT